jgi:hypothetical protein
MLLFHGYEESSDLPPRPNERACQQLATTNDSSLGRRCERFSFRKDQLREIVEQCRAGEKELVQVCNAITDQMGGRLRPGERIVTQYPDEHGFSWHRSHGRHVKNVNPLIEAAMIQLAQGILKRGVKKSHATLLLPEYEHLGPVSIADVEKVFQQYNLWTGGRKVKIKPKQRCRYEADYTNLIWHADLHHFHQGEWAIAWITDRSRLCLGVTFLPNRSSIETAEALWEILNQYSGPYWIWTDNGTEFEGSFQMILKKKGIRHICSSPHNPQQNGKCERYRRTLEMAPKQADVAALIAEYNRAPHFRLP